MGGPQGLGEGQEVRLPVPQAASLEGDGNVLELAGGDGCTTGCVY